VQPSNRPPATQQPGSGTPVSHTSPVASLPGPLGGAVSAVGAMPASERVPLIVVLIGVVAAAIAAIGYPTLRRLRTSRPVVRRPATPTAAAAPQVNAANGSSEIREAVGVAAPDGPLDKHRQDS
jgi:hypothetical protein